VPSHLIGRNHLRLFPCWMQLIGWPQPATAGCGPTL